MQIRQVRTMADLEAFQVVEEAALAHHFVGLPADPIEERIPLLEGTARAGELTRLWVGQLDDGRPVASLSITFPLLDNLEVANIDGAVHPDHSGRGLGRDLLAHALEVVRAEGRTRVFIEAPWLPEGRTGPAFGMLEAVGALRVLDDERRILDLLAHPPGDPAAVPVGYQVVQWTDSAPESLVEGCAYLLGRMILDMPMGESAYEQEKWDVARYRASEQDARDRGRTRVSTAVVHVASGAVAGVSDIGINQRRPEVSYQWSTIVDPDHRGHGLGLVLKTHNHRHLLATCPEARWINTWNASTNAHMVPINDRLGFRVAERWSEWQLDL